MNRKHVFVGVLAAAAIAYAWLKLVPSVETVIPMAETNHSEEIGSVESSEEVPTLDRSTTTSDIPEKPPVAHLTNSVYPLSPYDAYAGAIEDAINGDVDAQYTIYRVFAECSAAPRSEAAMEEISTLLPDDKAFIEEQRYRFERCKQFVATEEELNSARKTWFTEAYVNGHPMAVAKHEVFFGEDREVARAALIDALLTGDYESYNYAAVFIGKKLTNQPNENAEEYSDAWLSAVCRQDPACDTTAYDYKAVLSTSPWSYLACSRNPGCDATSFESDNLKDIFDQSTIDGIKARAMELEQLISQGRLEELGI